MLKQKFIFQYGTNIGLKIFGMLAGIIVARIAGPQVIGTLSYGLAYVSLFSIITGIFGAPHVKLVSEGRPLGKCMGTYAGLQFSAIGLFVVATVIWFFFQKYYLKHTFESRTVEIVVFIMIFKKALDRVMIFSEDAFLAKLQQVKSNLPKIILDLIYHPGRILIVWLGFRAVALASWELLVSVMVLPVIYKLLKGLDWERFDKKLAMEYVKYAIPILLYMIFGIISSQGDKIILEHYSNTTELGYYTAAYTFGGFVLLLGYTVGQIFFPLFSSYMAANDWDKLLLTISKYHKFIVIFLLPFLCAGALISGPLITLVLSAKYSQSIVPFSILLFSSFFLIWFMPYSNIITGKGRFYLYAFIQFLKLIVFIFSIFFLINPDYLGLGAKGLALNTFIVVLAEGIFYWIAAYRIGSLGFDRKNLSVMILVLFLTAVFYFIYPVVKDSFSFAWIIFFLGYLAIVYGILFLIKVMSVGYIRSSLAAFSPSLMRKYIKDEISGSKTDNNDK